MTTRGNLWAVGFDGTDRAAQVRDKITSLGWEKHQLILLDVAVAVRCRDGLVTLNGEPFSDVTKTLVGTISHFLAGLALGAPPLCGAGVRALLGDAGVDFAGVGISDDFVREVEDLIKPETSVLFVLDEGGDMDAILHALRGLGGTVLKTNVDLERAKLIQSTLATSADNGQRSQPCSSE
jgi:uncharacterized membrane protein